MRARSDSMAERLEHYRRKHAASLGKTDDAPAADAEALQIVLLSKN
jgi:hypothetical protein